MRVAVGGEPEGAVAEIDLGTLLHLHRRVDHLSRLLLPEDLGESLAVERAPRIEGAAQTGMSDEGRVVAAEGRSAEDMIGMHVGEHHVADRLVGAPGDLPAQPLPVGETAAGFRDEHPVPPDDETDIGDTVGVFRRRLGIGPAPDEGAGCDLLHRHGIDGKARPRQAAQAKPAEQSRAACDGGAQRPPPPDSSPGHIRAAIDRFLPVNLSI
jgi:hypothetical protein